MSIKKIKPWGRTKTGKFSPMNESKYVGPRPIIFRSSWEYKYCLYCDRTDDIIAWSSEPVGIKYYNPYDRKTHTYYPDFYIKVKQADNSIKEFLIEIKPEAQLKKPKPPKRKSKKAVDNYEYAVKEYIKNKAKAGAAKVYAKERSMVFRFLTEKSLR